MGTPSDSSRAITLARSTDQHTPSNEQILDALARIARSAVFQGAPAQRNLLRYIVERTVSGGHDLKEYCIAADVFGRDETFDSKRNSIVRIEARKLRLSLAKYYEFEGRADTVCIDLPKGGYVPTFRAAASAPRQDSAALVEMPVRRKAISPILSVWNRSRRPVAVAAVVLLLAFAAVYAYQQNSNREPASTAVGSLAVLPFLNLTANQEDESFADGLTEDVIDSLSRVPGVQVVAHTSAFQFKGKKFDVREVARKLNVRNVLEGSVRRYGRRIRVTVQLNDATKGYRVWSQSYDKVLDDALTIQRDVSSAITLALGVTLRMGQTSGPESAQAVPVYAPEAYEDYLKGLFFWNKNSPEGTDKAAEYFSQAIAQEPNYAAAYAGLAKSYMMLPIFRGTPPRMIIPETRAAALRAIELDPTLGDAHIPLARIAEFESRWDAAGREYQKAIELSPGNALVHRWYSLYLVKVGRYAESLEEANLSAHLDPISVEAAAAVAMPLYFMRRYDDAIAQSQKALALEPNRSAARFTLARAYLAKGAYRLGIAEAEAAHQVSPNDVLVTGLLGYAYAVSGERARAEKILADLLRVRPAPASSVAEVYAGLKDSDHAFEWLKKAYAQPELSFRLSTPTFDTMRSDRRFAGVARAALP